MFRGIVTAFRTLTCVPVPGRDADDLASSLLWFPLVGAALGGILYGVSFMVELALGGMAGSTIGPVQAWPEGLAFGIVVLGAVLTRGLHLDGLGDWADGFASMAPRKRVLEIMKDPTLGTFGVLALICVLGAKWLAVIRLLETGTGIWLVGAYVISRTVQVELACTLPYARSEGGTGASFVTNATAVHRFGAWGLALLLLALLGPAGPVGLIVGVGVAKLLAVGFRRRVGGVTGDLLGATSEITETVLLMAAAVPGTLFARLLHW